jgi:hypothetical protein
VAVPTGGLNISPDGKAITLEMKNVPVVDQPRWPALDAIATPARMAFKMVWKSTGEPVRYENASRQFRFTGTRAECQLEAQVEVLRSDFHASPMLSRHRMRISLSWVKK